MAGRGGTQKARKYDVSNTNIAGLGTNLEKSVKQAAAECEEQWKLAGKSEGLQIWRIEKFKVVPWPKEKYGKFYSGDSYIILNTHRKSSGALAWNAHFWIGDFSSQDEYGTAAYKTVELDDYLGGAAAQFREVQGKESRAFKKIFKLITILEGGVDTGFNHVKPLEYRHRLLHVKGKMNVIVREAPITVASLNSGDSFVYDGGLSVYVWHGREAAPMEKTKAAAVAKAMSDERGGKATVTIFMEGEGDTEWWRAFGGKQGTVKTAAEGGDDEAVQTRDRVLLKVSDESGKLLLTELARGAAIRRDMLSTKDAFILDDGFEVTVWVGKGASRGERKQSLSMAAKYLQQSRLPADTPIASCLEGGENEMFEAAFEVGVMSLARPETPGVKFTGNIDTIRGKQTTKPAAESVSPAYRGSGGPGVATDMDKVYGQAAADPAGWKGRGKEESEYSKGLQKDKAGAYGAEAGWVSGMSPAERAAKEKHIQDLEKKRAGPDPSPGPAPSPGGKSPGKGGSSTTIVAAGAGAAAAEPKLPAVAAGGYAGPIVHTGEVKPSLIAPSPFDAKADAQQLRKAMKGLGTNEGVLINILCRRTQKQRTAIREAYKQHLTRDLEKDLVSETSGNFLRTLKALVRLPAERDANFIFKSIKGLGTDDALLIELICSKDTASLKEIKSAYQRMFPGHSLEKDVSGDTSGDFKALLLAVLECKRQDPTTHVNPLLAEADAKALYKAGEKRMGTDEATFIDIFTTRSFPQLRATFEEYGKICKYDIRESVARETSFNFKAALQTIVDMARSPVHFFARRLYQSMKGAGTHDRGLVFLIVDRAEIDLTTIKEIFPEIYGISLAEMVKGDTSGDYQKALLTLLGV